MKKNFQNIFQSWITTIFGVALMAFAGYFFFINVKELTLENILIGSALGAVGFIFLFVKDELITGLFKKTTGKE